MLKTLFLLILLSTPFIQGMSIDKISYSSDYTKDGIAENIVMNGALFMTKSSVTDNRGNILEFTITLWKPFTKADSHNSKLLEEVKLFEELTTEFNFYKRLGLYNNVNPTVYREDDPPRNCPICSICINNNPPLDYVTPCKHLFHKKCLDDWMRKDVTCPNCREPLKSLAKKVSADALNKWLTRWDHKS